MVNKGLKREEEEAQGGEERGEKSCDHCLCHYLSSSARGVHSVGSGEQREVIFCPGGSVWLWLSESDAIISGGTGFWERRCMGA